MEHIIHRGDCRRHLARMADASIDAFVTDPPYGIELSLQWTRQKKVVRGDGRLEARRLWADFLPHAARLAKPDTAHLFFGTWKSIWIADLLREHFDGKGCVVWYKNTWGATLGAFTNDGSRDVTLYGNNGSPNTNGGVVELNWNPYGQASSWAEPFVNVRFGLQYTFYTRFSGLVYNVDGAGRRATDNNTLYLFTWLAF